MANSLLKLTVESSEYDAKLKKAAEGIRHLADVAHKGDGDLTGLEKSTLDYIKSVGEMETKSRTAAGSVRELESTYKELKVIYDQLNEVEKADEGGKALAASLETLKQRAHDAKSQLDTATQSLNANKDAGKEDSSILDSLAQKFTINFDAVSLFDKGLKAVNVALDVAKDAFFSSETNVDDWGRTVAGAESLYQSFVSSLNNSDFSGFLSNIQNVIDKATDAYNAMDELNTRMTIITPERTKLQSEATRLKSIIRREGKDSEAGKAAQEALRALEPRLSKAFQTESKLNKNAFTTEVDRMLAKEGIKLSKYSATYQMLMKSFSSDDVYEALKSRASGSVRDVYKSANGWGSYKERQDTRNMEQKLLDLFTDEWRQKYSPYLNASFSAMGSSYSALLGDARYLKEGGGGGGKGGKKTPKPTEAMDLLSIGGIGDTSLLTKGAEFTLPLEIRVNVDSSELTALQNELRQLTEDQSNFGKYSSETWQLYQEKIDEVNKEIQNFKGKDLPNQAEEAAKAFDSATNAIANIGSALQSIEDPGARVAGIIAQAIATIAQTFAASLKGTFTPWDWIAGAAAGTATMISTIAAIKSATSTKGYAEGGIVRAASGFMVPGNNYSGDLVPAYLNSGEMVLNKFQQQALAGTLENGGMKNISISGALRGEDIVLVADRYGRRTGKGELAFWR